MSRHYRYHDSCTHEDTKWARDICRRAALHSECTHELDSTSLTACDEMRKNHAECDHGSTSVERTKCTRLRNRRGKL